MFDVDDCFFADGDDPVIDGDDPVDGDDIPVDGDHTPVDGDVEGCQGVCVSSDPNQCVGDNLCSCDNGQWSLFDCVAVCQDAGYDNFETCEYHAEPNQDVCLCSYNQQAASCSEPIVISQLPFEYTGTTVGGLNTLNANGCEDEYGFDIDGGAGPERVFSLDVTNIGRLSLNLEVDYSSDFDNLVYVRGPQCSNNSTICLGSNDFSLSAPERFSYDFSAVSGIVFIIVDGGSASDSGPFTLDVSTW